jgi:uncharacterized protein (TIGR03032 family)
MSGSETMIPAPEGMMDITIDELYQATANLPEILEEIGGSLAISTYQAGRLVVVGTWQKRLVLSLHSFDYAMGIAATADRMAVGSSSQIWLLLNQHEVAPRLASAGQYDGCFVARFSHVTGEIRIHELAWVGRELWFVNTLFSCLCSLQPTLSFQPRWRPAFISANAAEDRCHLNGMAVEHGIVRYVTALAETDSLEGWRAHKLAGGCIVDVPTGEVVARGLAMPHSPRIHQGRLWVLDSGNGWLVTVDPQTGLRDVVAELPGYPRGLAFAGSYAFVGLSRLRETSSFGDLPIAQRREKLISGLEVVHATTGKPVARLEFCSGIHETFDVQVVPGFRCVAVCGPFPSKDGTQPVWTVPDDWAAGPTSREGR